ncbi:MAG TPA: hypothetical protein VFI00_15095 [Kribbella sp.]|nr:hypothetical protein [Kribbella sp.]
MNEVDVPLPLAYGELRVDRGPFDVGDESSARRGLGRRTRAVGMTAG